MRILFNLIFITLFSIPYLFGQLSAPVPISFFVGTAEGNDGEMSIDSITNWARVAAHDTSAVYDAIARGYAGDSAAIIQTEMYDSTAGLPTKFKGFDMHYTDGVLDSIVASAGDQRTFFRDYWAVECAPFAITSTAADKDLDSVYIGATPSGYEIRRVNLLWQIVTMETSTTATFVRLTNVAQPIRVKKSDGTWDVDDVNGQAMEAGLQISRYTKPASTPIMIGGLDISSEVDEGAVYYNLQLENADADASYTGFADVVVRCGLRVYYQPS